MRPDSIICRNCNRPCHVDKRFWRKITCANRQCGGKFLIEVPHPLESMNSTEEAATDQPLPLPPEFSKCPVCSGPVTVRERLWQKVNCVNSLCRTKFLIEALESPKRMRFSVVAHPAPELREDTPPPLHSSPRVIVQPTIVLVPRSRRRFARWKLAVCAIALVPCLLLLSIIFFTADGMTLLKKSLPIKSTGPGLKKDDGACTAHAATAADPDISKPNPRDDSPTDSPSHPEDR